MLRYSARIAIVLPISLAGILASQAPKREVPIEPEGRTMTGYITDTHCGCKEAKRQHFMCAYSCVEKKKIAQYAFCDKDTKLYTLEPQEMAAAYVGYQVKIRGKIAGAKIKSVSIELTEPGVYTRRVEGWITDTHCGAKGASENHRDCAQKCVQTAGAEYALYILPEKKMYNFDPQDKAGDYAGRRVKVEGIFDGYRVRSISIEGVDAFSR